MMASPNGTTLEATAASLPPRTHLIGRSKAVRCEVGRLLLTTALTFDSGSGTGSNSAPRLLGGMLPALRGLVRNRMKWLNTPNQDLPRALLSPFQFWVTFKSDLTINPLPPIGSNSMVPEVKSARSNNPATVARDRPALGLSLPRVSDSSMSAGNHQSSVSSGTSRTNDSFSVDSPNI
jgi:hypothetical protein